MTAHDLIPVLPLIILGAAVIAAMIASAFHRQGGPAFWIALAGLASAIIALLNVAQFSSVGISKLFIFDRLSVYFTGLVLLAGIFTVLLSPDYFEKRRTHHPEYYVMLLLAVFGAAVLTGASHFASFFLGLEILTISLYVLIAFEKTIPATEAAIKYLVLASVSTAFLLFGMAVIYAATGSMAFSEILPRAAARGPGGTRALFLASGAALTFAGIGFKLGVVPFHMWTPDVYEGSPAPVASFLSTVSKGAVFVLLLRYFTGVDFTAWPALRIVVAIVSVLSMFTGNLLALFQDNVKRILAYSSIAHLGYLLVALLAGAGIRIAAVSFYFAAYFATMLGAFGIVTVLSGVKDAEHLGDYRGLFRRRPVAAGIFTLMLLSLAGIPLTGGFIAKFYVMAAGAAFSLWVLVLALVAR